MVLSGVVPDCLMCSPSIRSFVKRMPLNVQNWQDSAMEISTTKYCVASNSSVAVPPVAGSGR